MRITDEMVSSLAAVDEDKRVGLALLWLWQADVLTDSEYAGAVAQATLDVDDDIVDPGGRPC